MEMIVTKEFSDKIKKRLESIKKAFQAISDKNDAGQQIDPQNQDSQNQ